MNNRIIDHPVLGKIDIGNTFTFKFDGKTYEANAGDTIASALLAQGIRQLRVHERSSTPRGVYCNIGHCMECRVTVNDESNIRACLTEVKPGMIVESGKSKPEPFIDRKNMPKTYMEFEAKLKSEGGGT